MVGSSSLNRSPTPMKQNSRSNDQKKEFRRSFSECPFAKSSFNSQSKSFSPSNHLDINPADNARRDSFGSKSGCLFRNHEQKENERDSNIRLIARAKSPCIATKGTKDFMTPTISSVSKINPSPRKKVLGERNESVRTSASFSDGKFHFFSTKSFEFGDETESKSGMEGSPCWTAMNFEKAHTEVRFAESAKHVVASPGEGRNEEPAADLVVLSPDVPVKYTNTSEPLPTSVMPKMVVQNVDGLFIKSAAYSSPCTIAPLDADPSLPPYDPKNNYLSPRPQFLHYNPTQRIETYANLGINLEDDFSSESFSEMGSSEEVHSENSQKEQDDAVSSVGTSPEEDGPSSESATDIQQLQETVEARPEAKAQWFTKWRTVVLVLLILLSLFSISMTYYPGFRNAVFQDEIISQMYSDPHAVAQLAKENLDDLFQNAKLWSARSVGFLLSYNAREVVTFPLPFSNSTGWQEEEDMDNVVKGFELWSYFENNEAGPQSGRDEDAEAFEELQSQPEFEVDEMFAVDPEPELYEIFIEDYEPEADLMFLEEPEAIMPEELEEHYLIENSLIQAEKAAANMIEQVTSVDETENKEEVENPEEVDNTSDVLNKQQVDAINEAYDISSGVQDLFHAQSDVMVEQNIITPEVEGPGIQPQVISANDLVDNALPSVVEVQSKETEMTSSVSENFVLEATDGNSEILEASQKSLAPIAAIVSLMVLSLLAPIAYMHLKLKNSTPLDDQLEAKEMSRYKQVSSNMEPTIQETASSWSGPVEVDMAGESCPSEMSSFQNTSSYNKSKQRGGDEAQSLQRSSRRSYKRESLATSSDYTMDSSYGSFTTSRIIHPKHGDGDVVTPVRRSSRIRTKVTSP